MVVSMNKILLGNALSASLALLMGFYGGTQWSPNGTGNDHPVSPQRSADSLTQLSAPGRIETATVADKSTASEVESKPEPVAPVCPEQIKAGVARHETAGGESKSRWAPVVSGFDRKKLEATYQQIYSEDAEQRNQALRILAALGAEEVVPELIRIATDEGENSEVRRDLIQQLQWSGHTRELAGILTQSRDADARLAAVNTISSGKMTDAEVMDMEAALLENLRMEPEDGIKIATLNHFLSVDPVAFQQVIEQYPSELSSPEVENYLKMITTPPEQIVDIPQQVDGAGG